MANIKPEQIKVVNEEEKPKVIEEVKENSHHLTFKRLGIFVFVALVLFVILNTAFFWKNIAFLFSHKTPAPISNTQPPVPTMEPNTLVIESLNINAPVQYVDEAKESVFQEALINGVVHYPGTAGPGEFGNVYIFGHSSDFVWSKGKYKTVFALLPKIQNGAEVFLSNQSGQKFTYRVFNQFVTSPNDTSVLAQGDKSKKLLTVQTSYPVGTALQRYIVQAELVE